MSVMNESKCTQDTFNTCQYTTAVDVHICVVHKEIFDLLKKVHYQVYFVVKFQNLMRINTQK